MTAWSGARTGAVSGRLAARWGDDYRNARDTEDGEEDEQQGS